MNVGEGAPEWRPADGVERALAAAREAGDVPAFLLRLCRADLLLVMPEPVPGQDGPAPAGQTTASVGVSPAAPRRPVWAVSSIEGRDCLVAFTSRRAREQVPAGPSAARPVRVTELAATWPAPQVQLAADPGLPSEALCRTTPTGPGGRQVPAGRRRSRCSRPWSGCMTWSVSSPTSRSRSRPWLRRGRTPPTCWSTQGPRMGVGSRAACCRGCSTARTRLHERGSEPGAGRAELCRGAGRADLCRGTGRAELCRGAWPADLCRGTGPAEPCGGTGGEVSQGPGPHPAAVGRWWWEPKR